MSGRLDFKSIRPVPAAGDFVDIVLSKTQRKTPTVVHQGYQIGRIRSFYMRKVKFTCESFVEKLGWILEDFPKLDDIHPFYADLCNVLYDRDHYKLALGQLNVAKALIASTSRDYTRLLKYGDSLYRCKQLKRAALGRMCTIMKKHKSSLGYLEEVRKHLSRLPSIDPSTRTLLITGYPNVGKSSFMNKVTRADVEVQPYAFTTKSLYVGHMDYKYLRWQVLDTPGILDKPLEERNTIEMQAITALAHLQCCVLYFVDLSEQCGWTLEQQAALFDNIRPLFANKPLVVVANKIDVTPMEELEPEQRALLDKMVADSGAELLPMSAAADMNIAGVKQRACEMLLERRVEIKAKSKKAASILNRLTVAMPQARDGKQRPAQIPASVLEARERRARRAAALAAGEAANPEDSDADMDEAPRRTLKDIEQAAGGPGHVTFDYRRYYKLREDEWKFDVIPEIIDGKNIADFVDPDIMEKLEQLEKEEDERAAREDADLDAHDDAESDMDEEEKDLVQRIRTKKKLAVARHRDRKHNNINYAGITRPTRIGLLSKESFKGALDATGHDAAQVDPPLSRRGRKRERERDLGADSTSDAADGGAEGRRGRSEAPGARRSRSMSRAADEADSRPGRSLSLARARSVEREAKQSLGTVDRAMHAEKRRKKLQKHMQQKAMAGEGDRRILTKMPKHLFSGKRGFSNQRR